MDNALVSVLIPAYNHEAFITEAVTSVINQTYNNIELIVIDDGSTDKTFEILYSLKPECEKRFTRVVMETQENQGVAITSNKTFSLANGKYLFLLASDDVLEKDAIKKGVDFLEKNNDYVCVIGDNAIIDSNSQKVRINHKKEIVDNDFPLSFKTYCEFSSYTLYIAYGKLLQERTDYRQLDFVAYDDLLFGHWLPIGALIRREVALKALPYSVNTPLEDLYLMLQVAKFGKIKVLKDIFLNYRLHKTNACYTYDKLYINNIITFAYELYLVKTKYPAFYRSQYSNLLFAEVKKIYDQYNNDNEQKYIKKNPEIKKYGYIPSVYFVKNFKKHKIKKINIYEKILYKIFKKTGKILQKKGIVENLTYLKND